MFNPIAYGQESQTITTATTVTTAVTFGYGPNQTAPPRELILNNGTAAVTVVLPPINTQLPSPPTTSQAIVGCGDGFIITLRNNITTVPTISAYSAAGLSTDTIADTLTLSTSGAVQTLIANATNATWYKLAN